jgi:hypothetical protein
MLSTLIHYSAESPRRHDKNIRQSFFYPFNPHTTFRDTHNILHGILSLQLHLITIQTHFEMCHLWENQIVLVYHKKLQIHAIFCTQNQHLIEEINGIHKFGQYIPIFRYFICLRLFVINGTVNVN